MCFKSVWRKVFGEHKNFVLVPRLCKRRLVDILHIFSFSENCVSDFQPWKMLLLILERNSLYLKIRYVPCSKEHKAEIWIKKCLKRLFLKKTEKDCQADRPLHVLHLYGIKYWAAKNIICIHEKKNMHNKSIRNSHGVVQNAGLMQSNKEDSKAAFECASRKKRFALSQLPVSKNLNWLKNE